MGFFDRFKKPAGAADLSSLQARGDYAGLAKAYYQMGRDALAKGDQDRARLWLGRVQALTDASDETYEKVGDAVIDAWSDLMGQLEDAPLLTNRVASKIQEEFGTLSGAQRWQWCYLSLCRLEKLLTAAGSLRGCEPLRDTGAVLDALAAGFYGSPSEEDLARLEGFNDFLAEWADTPAYYDPRQELAVPGGAALQLLDLNGEIVPTELSLFFDMIVSGRLDPSALAAHAPQQVLDSLDLNDYSGTVRCGLLTDYYLRTREEAAEEIPAVQAEERRIWDDLAFVRSSPDRAALEARAAGYRGLSLPA